MTDEPREQLPGLRATVKDAQAKAAATRRRKVSEADPAAVDPVARVLVDVPLAHLDRPFDYLVPAKLADAVVPGSRVKVRFAGQDVDAYVVERAATSDHPGQLTLLRRSVSSEPVLAPEIVELSGALAQRYAGSRADVLRLAVPPRHAKTEAEEPPPAPAAAPRTDADAARAARAARAAWADHDHAMAFLGHLSTGGAPRAVWSAAPGSDWPLMVAHAVAAVVASGRGAVVCVPDRRDVDQVSRALGEVLGDGQHLTLTADEGPAERYRRFLAVSRGAVRVVVGTRSASFAPVHDLGLVVCWDDGDDLHAEPRAPYPHTRETLLLRAAQQGTAVLLGGFARSAEAHYLVRTGWAHEIAAARATLRERVAVAVAGADNRRDPHAGAARIPAEVHRLVKDAVGTGPVLVQVPRVWYAASLACERCREPARCRVCSGPLALPAPTRPLVCRWCGTEQPDWACSQCAHRGLRAPVVGDARTAEELGRAFPAVRVRSSSGDKVVATVPGTPAIVVATPGAEPVAEGGYAAVVVLDTWLTLARADLRTAEEAVRRWAAAIGLVRPGGRAVLVGDPAHPALQALVRWDPVGFAEREIAERHDAHPPPASRLATITGEPGPVDDALTLLAPPDGAEVLGPVPVDRDESRVIVRVPRAQGAALSAALLEVQRVRSARKLDPVRIQVDPVALG